MCHKIFQQTNSSRILVQTSSNNASKSKIAFWLKPGFKKRILQTLRQTLPKCTFLKKPQKADESNAKHSKVILKVRPELFTVPLQPNAHSHLDGKFWRGSPNLPKKRKKLQTNAQPPSTQAKQSMNATGIENRWISCSLICTSLNIFASRCHDDTRNSS